MLAIALIETVSASVKIPWRIAVRRRRTYQNWHIQGQYSSFEMKLPYQRRHTQHPPPRHDHNIARRQFIAFAIKQNRLFSPSRAIQRWAHATCRNHRRTAAPQQRHVNIASTILLIGLPPLRPLTLQPQRAGEYLHFYSTAENA